MTAYYSHMQSIEALKHEDQFKSATDAAIPAKRSTAKSKPKANADIEASKADDVRSLFLACYCRTEIRRALLRCLSRSMQAEA